MKKNSKRILFVVLSIICVGGYLTWSKMMAAKYQKFGQGQQRIPDVTTISVAKQMVQLTVDLPAIVSAKSIAEIRPQVQGVIEKVSFTEGAMVKKGQQLYSIEPDAYLAAFNSAKRNLEAAKAKRNRYKTLLEYEAISKQEFADMEFVLAEAKSNFTKAKKNLDYAKVLAPISGYIGKTNYTQGALVVANQSEPLTTITQLDPIYVDMEQPSKDVIAAGHHKELEVELITEDENYHNIGKLKFSEMFVDPETDSVRIRAVFHNKDKKLLPGMFAVGRVKLQAFEAITVPQRATNRTPDGNLIVWVVDADNSVKMRQIKADKVFGDSWVVEDGLVEGETIVYEGFQKIAEGAKVNPTTLESSKQSLEKTEPQS